MNAWIILHSFQYRSNITHASRPRGINGINFLKWFHSTKVTNVTNDIVGLCKKVNKSQNQSEFSVKSSIRMHTATDDFTKSSAPNLDGKHFR